MRRRVIFSSRLAFSSHRRAILERVQSGRCGTAEMVLEVCRQTHTAGLENDK